MRYVGSKRRLAPYLLPFINWGLERYPNGSYIEPFVGGANMICKVQHHTRIGYDANKWLIALLNEARTNPDAIRNAMCPSKDAFKYIKYHPEIFYPWYVGLVGLLPTYANKWMESYNEHNAPGTFSGSMKHLLEQNLEGIHFINSYFDRIPTGKGNVIYCDPPYKHSDFYGMGFNHELFCDWVRNESSRNIVFVSEYEMPSDFECIWSMPIKPGINHKATIREEKLFIYNP